MNLKAHVDHAHAWVKKLYDDTLGMTKSEANAKVVVEREVEKRIKAVRVGSVLEKDRLTATNAVRAVFEIATSHSPLSLLENEFRTTVLSRRDGSRYVSLVSTVRRLQVVDDLKPILACGVAVDGWADGRGRQALGISLHYINHDWELVQARVRFPLLCAHPRFR